MATRFAIATLGCKVNQYDSAIIESRLRGRGMVRAEFTEKADVYIVNTCTITDRADAESLRIARRARRLNPNARIVMTGCLAQASPDVLAKASEVDAVIGLGRLDDLERTVVSGAGERVLVTNLRKEKAPIELAAVALDGHTRAFLKLQEGCDQFCTFCIVPFSRGSSRSVEPRRVMAALDDLHARGFKEVVLTGVHLGGYGKDLDPPVELADLLEMIAERCPIERVRISSLDPEELSDRIVDTISGSAKFCPHLHLPLQSGDDETLSRMRRRYARDYFRDRVERVLRAWPDAAIGTDLIVGFPGETAAHFESYFNFVQSMPLAYFHVFPYSVRAGTTAAKFSGRVKPPEIKRRAAVMRELGERKRLEFARRFVGAKLKVLLEERGPDGKLRGYSRNYVRVSTQGPDELTNREVEVEASTVEGIQLVGEIVRPWAAELPAAGPPESPGTKLERMLGYTFARGELLEIALTHPSAAVGSDVHYERLEFLGDAVLDLAIADLLMRKFPTAKEGPLSKQRASIVNARTLALKAQAIELNEMMRLGKGEEKSGGREKTSILAAVFEAVIGAIYTDGGLAPAQQVVEHLFENDIGGPSAERDYKTELQEIAYRHFRTQPVYELVAAEGPDHAKRFTTRIRIAGRELGVAEGGSKKQSEQAAARLALDRIEEERGERDG